MPTLQENIDSLLLKVPTPQRAAASELIVQYGPRLFEMAQAEAWQYLRRLMAGDLAAVVELDAKLSDDQFIAQVNANSAQWENVANYNIVRNQLKNEILLKIAPIILSILAALVGL